MPQVSSSSEVSPASETVSRDLFREGMARLSAAVNIVTTDGAGGRAGFTASAVCSVTDTPPTLLVCINRSSSAAPAFAGNDVLCVNTIGPDHVALAKLFGGKTPMAERFDHGDWHTGTSGAPILDGAVVSFDCRIALRQVVGTHEVMFCEVLGVRVRPDTPATAYFNRAFHDLPA